MKSKTFFSVFLAMAGVPLLLAFVVLKMGWFTPGATNKGEFVRDEISLTLPHDKPTWSIVYQPSSACGQMCQEQLYSLNQTHIALGKLQKRVSAYVLDRNTDISAFSHLVAEARGHEKLKQDYIYLVDPFGKVILQYAGSNDRQQTIQTSKDIIADVKKLLNYARVG